MPFRIDLAKVPSPKIWTSRITPDAEALQALFDREDAEGYAQKLAELRSNIPDRSKHDFRLTDGRIYEIFDEGHTQFVPIQFMVKGTVITWSFSAPKDETHQDWRDEIFNTAAIAHQSVDLGCETYYRGSNAYHLKKMHSHAGESGFNHNHYRLVDEHPITPVEVEQHLRAFYNQALGKKFIPDPKEVDAIVYAYKTYWAEYELDPRYSAYYPLGKPNENKVLFQNLLNAKNSDVQDEIINQFLLRMKVDKSLIPLAHNKLTEALGSIKKLTSTDKESLMLAYKELPRWGLPPHTIANHLDEIYNLDPKKHGRLLVAFEEFVRKTNFCKDFEFVKGYLPPQDDQVNESSRYVQYQTVNLITPLSDQPSDRSNSISSSGSPSEQYSTALDQIMTLDDQVEFELYAVTLTNRCRSVDDAMLGQLRPEDFRKALRLYNAMKCLTQGVISEEDGQRFDPEIYQEVIQLKDEINGMCPVDEDPGPAMEHLFKWLQNAPPEFEKWLKWIEVNGSRGLGSELAHTREADGSRNKFFVPQDDRAEGEVADVFNLKPKSQDPRHLLALQVRQYVGSLMHLMGSNAYQQKARVGTQLMKLLEGDGNLSTLSELIQQNPDCFSPEISHEGVKGSLTALFQDAEQLLDLSKIKDDMNYMKYQ